MKRAGFVLQSAAVAGVLASLNFAGGRARQEGERSPVFGVTIPAGYRQWGLISVAEDSSSNHLKAFLGNALARRAYRDGTVPFPDGASMVKLTWKREPLDGFDGASVSGGPRPCRSWSRPRSGIPKPAAGGSGGTWPRPGTGGRCSRTRRDGITCEDGRPRDRAGREPAGRADPVRGVAPPLRRGVMPFESPDSGAPR